ncbi:unnamed protein product [Pleuronectes platessa]|uniref:Uncharacterized protein n=1 Tax=Pleuronectes platessa TaxID=8262 RepID=A0A9N7VPN6_PLEPL|nr:unnamed protein product [Pleuronectes platessa]
MERRSSCQGGLHFSFCSSKTAGRRHSTRELTAPGPSPLTYNPLTVIRIPPHLIPSICLTLQTLSAGLRLEVNIHGRLVSKDPTSTPLDSVWAVGKRQQLRMYSKDKNTDPDHSRSSLVPSWQMNGSKISQPDALCYSILA